MNETAISALFPSLKCERSEAGTRIFYQDAQGLLDNILICFHSRVPQVSCEVPEDSSRIELPLKEPDHVVRFIEAFLLCFLEENCRMKALRGTTLGKWLAEHDWEEAMTPEVCESLAPVIRKLLPLAAARGATLIPLRHPRGGIFTFWAASSGDYAGLDISEAPLAGRDAIPLQEITLNRAGDWLIEERPAVSTTELLKGVEAARRRDWLRDNLALAGVAVVVLAVMLGLGLLGIRFLEWLEDSGYSWLVAVLPAVLAVWLAWSALRRIPELMKLIRQARHRPLATPLVSLALVLIVVGVGCSIWFGLKLLVVKP